MNADAKKQAAVTQVENAVEALEGRRPPNLLNPPAWK